ncbi:hypothetical protein CAMGR0001_0558 [Campylobacter gracilis RM3268]|uniref:Uncharacterized protein n=1 Tax=Campylobacter gracilis RM3268 TaxID=553220 RepID=C8PHW2_9BACT|nr:hypothetical protein CAMGR0001_0558 [Campylobacter gracilis RM3268]
MIFAAQLNFYIVEFCRLRNLKFKATQILSRLVHNFKFYVCFICRLHG